MKLSKLFTSSVIILFSFLILSTAIKFIAIDQYNTPFSYDQGRDMIDIRHIVTTMSPTLVGPTTSINGLLLGPFWYYFNLPAFVLGGGNPLAISIWNIVWFQIAVTVFYFATRKFLGVQSLLISLLLLISPAGFYTARYFWNANSAPIFTLVFLTFLIVDILSSKRQVWISIMVGIFAGLTLQVEAAFGILLIPFFVLVYLFLRRFSQGAFAFLGFTLTLIPQLLFELRHSFYMSKLLYAEFFGDSKMLGESLTLADRFASRFMHYTQEIYKLSHIPASYVTILFIVSVLLIIIGVVRPKMFFTKDQLTVLLLGLAFVVFSFVFYLFFPMEIKYWYLLGVHVPLIIVLSASLIFLERFSFNRIFVSLFFVFALFHVYLAQTEYFRDYTYAASTNPSLLRNQLAAIDWIYNNAAGQSFKVYNYVPAVYDYQWNQLFWWQGNLRYHPTEVAYAPNQPVYIVDQPIIFDRVLQDDSKLIFLIMEQDHTARLQNWRHDFNALCQIDEETIAQNIIIHKLTTCP